MMIALLIVVWLITIFIFAARPHHRQNVYGIYIFVIGIIALVAYFIGRMTGVVSL